MAGSFVTLGVQPAFCGVAGAIWRRFLHSHKTGGSCRVTNPHEFEADGLTFLGTSGQNVEDIHKYSTREDRLKILEAVLEWGHLVPTAPDTLGSYPYAMDDPFLLESAPHVAFAGNQPTFQTGTLTGGHCLNVLAL